MSVDDRIADWLQVAGIQVHMDGRMSAFDPVWEIAFACLEPGSIVQATGSIALTRDETR